MEGAKTYEAFKYQWKVWWFTGLHPPKDGYKRRLYIVYAIFLNIFITLLFPVMLTVNCFFSSSLKDLCDNLTITVTDIMCNLKLLNVFVKKQKLLEVEYITEKLDERAAADEDEKDILRRAIKSSHRFFFIFLYLYLFTAVTSIAKLFFTTEHNLISIAWIPLDWKNSSKFNFVLANTYQLLGLIVQGTQDAANDTYPQAFLNILCSHMQTLSVRVSKISRTPHSNLRDNYKELVACIQDHQDILRLYNTIREVISMACLAQFVSSGLVQCTIGIYCLYIGFDISRLTFLIGFFIAVTLEIYVLCYFGDQLLYESEKFEEAIYSSNWIDQSKEFKSSLRIFMQRSQKPLVIMAGGIIPVTLQTFLKVLKTAYSFFAVLNKIK